MYREKNKATCRRFIQQIFNEGDLASIRSSIRAFVSPDSLHHELDDWAVSSGHNSDGFADMIYLYRLAFPDLRVDIRDQIAERDQVVSCLRMQGTQEGPLLGVGASGKPMDITGIRVDRLEEGKITESWFHWDGLGMLQQIGALPPLARSHQEAPWAKAATVSRTVKPFPIPPAQYEPHLPPGRLKPAA